MSGKVEQEKLAEITEILTVITGRMVIPLYFVFWFLDLIYVPQYKWEFLALRSLVIPFALITHSLISRARHYRQAEYVALFYAFGLASIINTMIFILGVDSTYFYGLTLIAVGGLSFIPWSCGMFIATAIAIYAPYFIYQFTVISEEMQYRELAVTGFITLGIVVVTWVINRFRERLRRQELDIRHNLESEIERRKETELQLIVARDEALAATQAKQDFLANMSHEIRTPLTGIIGYAETSLDIDQTPVDRTNALQTIRRSGDHLLTIINDILDFSKIEAGQLDVESIDINPLQLVAEVESILSAQASRKDIEFQVDYSFPLPAVIQSDPVRLKQILINLGGNAIKFTEQGKVSIELKMNKIDTQDILSFSVRDTGIGMSDEQLKKIFTPFKQADKTTSRRFGGTGLGLSLSTQLAKLLDGNLKVSSLPDEGSVFTLNIPCRCAGELKLINSKQEMSATKPVVQTQQNMPRLEGSILLAEDNEVNQQIISVYLEKMGAHVTIASNGQEAVRQARAKRYDLVYMDMQMPLMNGIDAVKMLRAGEYSGPIVALTANATSDDKELCRQAGFDDFATKPIVRQKLYETTARFLPLRAAHGADIEPINSQLLEEDPDFLEVVIEFVKGLPRMHKHILDAFRDNDWIKLARVVHDLKATSGGTGYPQLSYLAEEIEDAIRAEKYSIIGDLIESLTVLCQRVYLASPQDWQTEQSQRG